MADIEYHKIPTDKLCLEKQWRKDIQKMLHVQDVKARGLATPEMINLWKNEAQYYDPNYGFNPYIDWAPADDSILRDLQFQRVLSEELAANGTIYAAILNQIRTHVTLGGFGFAMDVPGNPNGINDKVLKHFKRWARNCDAKGAAGVSSLNDVIRISVNNYLMYGEVFGLIVHEIDGNPEYSIKVQGISPMRVEDPRSVGDKRIKMGIELSPMGKPKKLWIRRDIDSSKHFGREYFDELGNPVVLHWYNREFFEQSHGRVGVTCVYRMLMDLSEYMKQEVRAAANGAAINIIARRVNPAGVVGGLPTGGVGDPSSSSSQLTQYTVMPMDAGQTLLLRPEDIIEQFKNERPSDNFGNFIETALSKICSAFGFSYEYVFCKWADSNSSSARMNCIHTQEKIKEIQKKVIDCIVHPLVRKFLMELVENEKVDIGSMDLEDFLDCFTIVPPKLPLLDPLKEAQTAALKLANSLTTLEIECANYGYNWKDILEQRGIEIKMMKELGIAPPVLPEPGQDEAKPDDKAPAQVGPGKPPSDDSTRS